jgi:lysophospholipase L1-like esterase
MSISEKSAASPGERVLSPGRRFLFIGMVLLLLAGLQEFVCRWLFPLPECASFNRMNYTPVNLFGNDLKKARHRGLSNVKLRWESEPDGFLFDHTLNLYGFRGPNFSLDPTPDRSRVLFIGDSFTEGAGAADADTIPAQFAQLVQDTQPVEAINLGISGTGLADYTLIARDSLPLLKPQALFLVICFNDLPTAPMSESRELAKPAPSFPRLNPYVPRAGAALGRWWAGEVVPGRYLSGPFPFLAPVPSPANPLSSMDPPANIDAQVLDAMERGKTNAWTIQEAALHEQTLRMDYAKGGGGADYLQNIAAHCERQGCRLIVVYIPHQVTANPIYMRAQIKLGVDYGKVTQLDGPMYRAQQRHLQQVTQALAIPFLDSTEAFIEAEKTSGGMFWPIDGHCTAAGYRLLAETCAHYWTTGALPRTADGLDTKR